MYFFFENFESYGTDRDTNRALWHELLLFLSFLQYPKSTWWCVASYGHCLTRERSTIACAFSRGSSSPTCGGSASFTPNDDPASYMANSSLCSGKK